MTAVVKRVRGGARWWDLLGLLLGMRPSIERLIHARQGWLFAAALVATAALGREYDAVSLWHQPYDLLGSFAASTIIASVLFHWMWGAMKLSGLTLVHPERHAIVFLTGYWLTAPLAWLYALPIEAIADEVTSLRYNLTALSIVSIWRVLLFARISSIQFRIPYIVSLSWILVPCMVIAFFGMLNSVLSMVTIMGGIRLTQTQQILVNYQSAVLIGLWWSFLPVVGLAIAATVWLAKQGSAGRVARTRPRVSGLAWTIPAIVTLTLTVAATRFQPALQRAHQVDQMLIAGNLDQAIALLETRGEAAFPPAWDPPPQFHESLQQLPEVGELARALAINTPPVWVNDRLMVQADEILLRQYGWSLGAEHLSVEQGHLIHLDASSLQRLIEDLESTVQIPLSDRELSESFRNLLEVAHKSLEYVIANERSLEMWAAEQQRDEAILPDPPEQSASIGE